jgi:hypothetical protein
MATVSPPRSTATNYYELTPANWPHHLAVLKSQGIDEIALFIPWGLHESVQGIRDFSKASRLRLEKFLGLAHQAGLTVRASLGFPASKESFPQWSLALGETTALVPSSLMRGGKGSLSMGRLPSIHDERFFCPFLEFLSDTFALLSLYRFPEGPLVGVNLDWGVFESDLGVTAVSYYGSFLQERYPQASIINMRYQCTFRDFATATSTQGTRVLLDKRPWLAAYDYKYCRAKMLAERAQGVLALPAAEPLLDLLSFERTEPSLPQAKENVSEWSIVMDPTLLEGAVSSKAFPFAPLGILNAQAASVFRLWEYLAENAKKASVPLVELQASSQPKSPLVVVIAGRFLPQSLVRTLRTWAEAGTQLYFPFGAPQYDENLATVEWKPGMARLPYRPENGSGPSRIGVGRGFLHYSDGATQPEPQFWERLIDFSKHLRQGAQG